jgi:hypothetical protein
MSMKIKYNEQKIFKKLILYFHKTFFKFATIVFSQNLSTTGATNSRNILVTKLLNFFICNPQDKLAGCLAMASRFTLV